MRLAIGSDEQTHLTDMVVEELKRQGHAVELYGPLAGEALAWPEVAEKVAGRVAKGLADQGLLFCWTGTGVSIAANKVRGIRAALCWDAETALGARRWNDANVLCLSLRSTSEELAREILNAWFSISHPDRAELSNIQKIGDLEKAWQGSQPPAAVSSEAEPSPG